MTLRLAGVSYTYAGGHRQALRDVDLELRPGQVVGVAGASEAGKSTLCLVAAGLAPAVIAGQVAGRVTIDGADTARATPNQLAQRCGILFQHPATQISGTTSTVWEEIALGPRNLSRPLDDVVERTWSALSAVGIDDLAEREPTQLSGGQLQLVALAAVIAMRPAYLVLDEPTAQLDPAGTSLVGRAIGALAADGAGVLLAEQKTGLLADLARHVVVLADGAIVAEGAPADVFADDRLDEWLVEAPERERLGRALHAAGISVELPS